MFLISKIQASSSKLKAITKSYRDGCVRRRSATTTAPFDTTAAAGGGGGIAFGAIAIVVGVAGHVVGC